VPRLTERDRDRSETGKAVHTETIRVAVIDDHPIARQGLAKILEDVGSIELVASIAVPGDLDPTRTDVDVVLLDLYLDGHVMALDAITAMSARVPVLVISASRHPADVLAAVRAGASGYLSKHASEAAYATAIQAVAHGRFHLSAQLADMLQTEVTPKPATGGRSVLSAREQEALGYIARGFTHTQTATRMKVSKATVDTYVARIRTKLGLGNKAELAIAALTHLDNGPYPRRGHYPPV
jgi:DNA-binding NarL/FixJ family response regulator